MIFFGVFEKFETFFSKICAHSERYRNLLAGIFEIPTFYGHIAFPMSPVLRPTRSSGSTEGALEEAGRAEQHIITEAASNELKLGEGA